MASSTATPSFIIHRTRRSSTRSWPHLIDLDEGVRVLSNLVEVEPSDITVGMPVTVDFRPTRHDGAVPVFKPKAKADG